MLPQGRDKGRALTSPGSIRYFWRLVPRRSRPCHPRLRTLLTFSATASIATFTAANATTIQPGSAFAAAAVAFAATTLVASQTS